jgi:hypothetical protein
VALTSVGKIHDEPRRPAARPSQRPPLHRLRLLPKLQKRRQIRRRKSRRRDANNPIQDRQLDETLTVEVQSSISCLTFDRKCTFKQNVAFIWHESMSNFKTHASGGSFSFPD